MAEETEILKLNISHYRELLNLNCLPDTRRSVNELLEEALMQLSLDEGAEADRDGV
jgi:hypothetical protein